MNNNSAPFSPHSTSADDDEEEEEEDYSGDYGEALDPSEDALCLATASMWTRKDIREFKESIRKDEGDGILKVGHGETVTVRVPTHADGTCLFWEFATDTYDIGFGVSFEWNNNPGTQVSVNISESEDDDLDDDDGMSPSGGLEIAKELEPQEGPVRVIIPVYRRDCHEEVYVGSHVYPGRGVYLLKFDNSYSLWRSKTLYYRVYYTR
ncbi:ACBD3 [Cordylochernes scorpioides]|uniref:ACBD3 n=1 Tax=Cordylochernes scorpioides TaxID=51811 RepID=A0ABY6K5X6_9ARAC|nr:ACBD3 [Cordylochernes scorpioides]